MTTMTPDQPNRNRGKNSGDDQLFATSKQQSSLREALRDMHYLLSRDFPPASSLALVGNRYRLNKRQQLALQGMSAAEADIQNRKSRQLSSSQLRGETVWLDGFNILILLETLFSGGYVFKGLDGCYRDISSVHGTYKRVNQTEDALIRVGNTLKQLETAKVIWIFDSPVSNSGRLKTFCYELAAQHNFPWDIHLENSPDKFLVQNNRTTITSDAWVLNNCSLWFNLGAHIIGSLQASGEVFDNLVALAE